MSIKQIEEYPTHWIEGLPIRITELIHGRCQQFSIVKDGADWEFVSLGHIGENVVRALNNLCNGENPVRIYGVTIFPAAELDYGQENPVFLVHDIKVNGEYLPWDLVRATCELNDLRMVPLLYEGIFSWKIVENMTVGGSVVAHPSTFKSEFKGRKGIVITPLLETNDANGERLIAKTINPDFGPRRNSVYTY